MAQEARMRKTFVCEKPEDCPDDDDCCHKQVPEGLHGTPEIIERFANLIAAAERNRTWTQDHWTQYERSIAATEREACAKLCDKQANNLWEKNCDSEGHGADQCAAAIRARGQHDKLD
tara:strand:- start:613 stop:966 length:354 start_codon:yes stop_codon:yes gene_type:complete